MPWIRYPYSAAALAMPLMWGPLFIISVLWLCTFWLGQSIIATLVVWWITLGQITMHIKDGQLSFDADIQSGTWVAIAAVVLNWALLILWCTRHSRRERRERRNWLFAPPEADPGWNHADYGQQQPFGAQTGNTRELSYEEQFEADVQYWQRVQAEASTRVQPEHARLPRFE